MIKYIIQRILWMIPVLLGVILIVFSITYFMPGDPVEMLLGEGYTQEEYDIKAEQIGLTGGYFEQLGRYLNNIIHGSLGVSYQNGREVTKELSGRVWVSIRLGLMSCILTLIVSIPAGIITAIKKNSIGDYIVTFLTIFLASMPSFWLALMFIILFALNLGWLPATGLGSWRAYILPVVCSALPSLASITRMTRSSMLEVINADYIRTARAKGVPERTVILRHALKNALIPIITVMGGQFSMVIGGSVVVETIFNIPGMGMRLVSAINARDYSVILGITIIMSIFSMVILLLVDLFYAAVDPRIRAQFAGSGKSKKKSSEKEEVAKA